MVTIPIKKTNKLAKTPTRGSDYAAGYDLYSTEDYTLKPLERKLFKTGISVAIPNGSYGRIAPRSGLAYKDGIDVMAGVIDEDYRGEIGVILINLGSVDKVIKAEEKIAQLIIEYYVAVKFQDAEELPATNRGDGGYGSTDTPKVAEGALKSFNAIVENLPGTTLAERYQKVGGVSTKKKYSEEIKERQQLAGE